MAHRTGHRTLRVDKADGGYIELGLGTMERTRLALELEDALSALMGQPCHVVVERKAKG